MFATNGMNNNINFNKILYGIFIVVALVLIVPAINYISVALGFNGPTQNPPFGSGALSAGPTGNIGINALVPPTTGKLVINPLGGPTNAHGSQVALDTQNGIIANVRWPDDGPDAANKDYVDAASGGGGKPVITVWGVSSPAAPTPWALFRQVNNATLMNCLLGLGAACNFGQLIAVPAAGANVSCPATWTTLVSGYGPYVYLNRQYFYSAAPTDNRGSGPAGEVVDFEQIPIAHSGYNTTSATYSICGANYYEVAQTTYSVHTPAGNNTSGTGAAAGVLIACIPQLNGTSICNTCKVCQAP